MAIDRRAFLESCSALGLTGLFPGALYARAAAHTPPTITAADIAHAANLAGLSFSEKERKALVESLRNKLAQYQALRKEPLPNHRRPSTVFDPRLGGAALPSGDASFTWQPPADVARPAREEDLAYASIATLSALLRARKITAQELTVLFLDRLKRLDPKLKAVITYTERRAQRAARRADAELDAGTWRGPLHGIPYGAKDLLAVEGYRTTWGATPYKDQTLDTTAAVVQQLDDAGAILIAKLSLGALAWGDVWFGGKTRNPWNVSQGSSGSSAGPGSAVAAGCVPFAIGSETLGSIVSPSTRNGVTGHRPTFGAVSRHGAMALSWTMDKLGPMTRSALDAALVFEAIRGKDPRDPTTVAMPFAFDPSSDLSALRVGYLEEAFAGDYDNAAADEEALDVLRAAGVTLEPLSLPTDLPIGALLNTLEVEAAAAFDELLRSGRVDELVSQGENTWPRVFKGARFVPAVEHVQMSRVRTHLMEQMHAAMGDLDGFVSPTFQGGTLSITNLTGHPCVCVPNAFRAVEGAGPQKQPGSLSFIGALYRDDVPLRLAHAFQQATDFHRRRPPLK
ncbi:amidase [Salisaeta longa]|uniref:amidase n=1 Tax=Salisaeta longa TaxID=503170 RepID=UPI0003B3D7C7|nr:amidase [Salisaeta longa]